MGEESRSPRAGFVVMLVLLAGSIAGTAWWLNRPSSGPLLGPPPEEIDVYCTGRVDAAGQVTALDPAQPGRVVEVHVKEGATVAAGQPLVQLDDAVAQARLIQAQATLDAAQVELDVTLRDKERVPNQIAAQEALHKAAVARVEAARKLLQQRKDQQQVTPLGKPEQEAMEAQVRELEQMEESQRLGLEDLKKLDPELRVRAARAKLKAAEADRDLAEKAVADCVLKAPGPGTILRLQAARGGLIAPGVAVPAVVFAPAGPPVVRAEVDQQALGRVAVGMTAEVQDENHPDGPVWKGRVKQIARWVAQRRSFVLEPGELNDVRTVECVIELDPPAEGLWIGQRMRVRIVRGGGPGPSEAAEPTR
jgi:multidrug resistance efflux pump